MAAVLINPVLLNQIEQIIEWGVSGYMDWQAIQAADADFITNFKAALAANRPMTDDEWTATHTAAQAAHDALANA